MLHIYKNLMKSRIILVLTLFILTFSFIMTVNAEGNSPQTYKIPEFWDVDREYSFSYQETNVSCVPASVQMVLSSYNVSPLPTQEELAIEMKTDLKNTTQWKYTYIPFNTRNYTEHINQSLSTNVDWALLYLKRNVSRNFPAIVATWYNQNAKDKGTITHGRVVTGYNETGIFFHDPFDGANRYLHNSDFTNLWETSSGYWALIVQEETSLSKEEIYTQPTLAQLFIDNLDVIALLIVGLASEKHFVSRLATFSNSIALDLFFIKRNFTPWFVTLYLGFGTLLGIIGLLAYLRDESLPGEYYGICLFLYSSVTAGLVMLFGIFFL